MLDRIVDTVVINELSTDVFREREHSGVFARAVVVELRRMFTLAKHAFAFLFVERKVGPASKMRFGQAGLLEH